MEDSAGPTAERLKMTDGNYTVAGRSRSSRRITLYDDALGRAWMSRKLSGVEYSALSRYAHHWASGGLLAPLQSVNLDRVYAYDPTSMSGLCRTERQVAHRAAYYAAREVIGTRPAFVADAVACHDIRLVDVGLMLGYRSKAHGRARAREILADAGYRLAAFWRDRR